MIRDRNIDPLGISSTKLKARQQYVILKPDVAVDSIVASGDVSVDLATATLAKNHLDYPRNLLYTLTDDSATTLEGIFTTIGLDQFGKYVTETVEVDYDVAATGAGSQIFSYITSIAVDVTNAAASDTCDVGVCIEADVASFGLPDEIAATTDVKAINFLNDGVTEMQNIDSTSVVVARNCFRPEQTVVADDDYIIFYKSTDSNLNNTIE